MKNVFRFKGCWQVVPLLLCLALAVSGCFSMSKREPLTERNAVALSVKLANREARRRFNVAPFSPESGYLRLMANGWLWQGLTSQSGRDVLAKVTFDRYGGTRQVEVDLQHSALPPPRLPNRVPEERDRPQTPPEIVK